MPLTVFQALDKAIEAGGTNLARKDITGSAKGDSAILDELCSSRLLDKTGGRSPKYSITPEGRAVWERDAPEERRREVQERERKRKRRALIEFLLLVEGKKGKTLTKTEAARFGAPVREACDQKLVEPGPKENSYLLLPAGKDVLLGEQPVEDQVRQLRELSGQAAAQWRAAHQRLLQELDGHHGPGVQALEVAAADLADRGRQASLAFEAAIAELGAFAGLLSAAQQLREGVKVGDEAERQVYLVGKAPDGRWAGLKTTVVET